MKPVFVLTLLALSLSGPALADEREPIPLNPAQEHFVRDEMRGFLAALQGIHAGLSSGDWVRVAALARGMGKAAGETAPPGLGEAFTPRFREWGSATHTGFDQLALDAESMQDVSLALGQLGEIMKNCMQCHATYRIESSARPAR